MIHVGVFARIVPGFADNVSHDLSVQNFVEFVFCILVMRNLLGSLML